MQPARELDTVNREALEEASQDFLRILDGENTGYTSEHFNT